MKENFNKVTQVFLPILTILGFFLTSIKNPETGLLFSLIAQIFWVYAGWQAWKKAGQFGIFITAILTTAVVLFGVVNYWIF